MHIQSHNPNEAQIVINNQDLAVLDNVLRLSNTAWLNDEEFSRYIEIRNQILKYLHPNSPITAAISPISPPASVAEVPVAPTIEEWGVHNRAWHYKDKPSDHPNCRVCIYITQAHLSVQDWAVHKVHVNDNVLSEAGCPVCIHKKSTVAENPVNDWKKMP